MDRVVDSQLAECQVQCLTAHSGAVALLLGRRRHYLEAVSGQQKNNGVCLFVISFTNTEEGRL